MCLKGRGVIFLLLSSSCFLDVEKIQHHVDHENEDNSTYAVDGKAARQKEPGLALELGGHAVLYHSPSYY